MLATMSYVEMASIGQEQTLKPVLYFSDHDKGLVLNKTNFQTIAAAYGDETEGWKGRQVVLFVETVFFRGESTRSIRVRMPKSKPEQAPAPARPDLDDSIPF